MKRVHKYTNAHFFFSSSGHELTAQIITSHHCHGGHVHVLYPIMYIYIYTSIT